MKALQHRVSCEDWPVHQFNFLLGCMDWRLNYEILRKAIAKSIGLQELGIGEYASNSGLYLLTSPGGAVPCMLLHAGKVLAENGYQDHFRVGLANIVISVHTKCAAVKASKSMKLSRSAKEMMIDIRLLEERFPGMLVARPTLHFVEVDIHTSLPLPGTLQQYEGQEEWWEKISGPSHEWLHKLTHRNHCITATI